MVGIMTTKSLPCLRITALVLIGAVFGFFMVLLLPVIFVTWLQSWIIQTREPADLPHRYDAGKEGEAEQVFDYTAYLPEWWWN
jgi:hypothetical protein